MPVTITKTKILLVEGNDELNLFEELLNDLNLNDQIQVIEVGGKTKFSPKLSGIKSMPEFRTIVTSIGIVRDADDDPISAFQSVCSALRKNQLPEPNAPLVTVQGRPHVTVMIVPDRNTIGMIENVCLESVNDDPAMECIDQFFLCLENKGRVLADNQVPKARVRAYLTSRELLEIAHFEGIQHCLNDYQVRNPKSAAVAVARTHAFLSSRYTPDLDLGMAAKKTDDRYWRFDSPVFDNIKRFLQMI